MSPIALGLGLGLPFAAAAPADSPPAPTVPTDGLRARWRFWDIASLSTDDAGTTPVASANDPIGRVTDASGNGLHLTQSGADSSKPLYKENVSGVLSAAHFDTDRFLEAAMGAWGAAACHIFVAIKSDTTVGGNGIWYLGGVTGALSGSHYPASWVDPDGEVYEVTGTDSRYGPFVIENIDSINLYEIEASGSDWYARQNGSVVESHVGTNTFGPMLTPWYLGRAGDGTSGYAWLRGHMFEMLAYDRALSAEERAQVLAYMQTILGTP
jgi:hypothetical protein